MDTHTGRLVREDLLRTLEELEQERFTPVPEELEEEAQEALGDQAETTVDLRSHTPLARWAVKENRKKRRRQANKRARSSRRINR